MVKHLIIPALLVGSFALGFVVLTTTEANAIVCARGLYRAGCVGGVGVVHPGVRRVAVAPRYGVHRRVWRR
ncbi:hypothetical protein SAMN05444170_7020 [Bradyrhizobium erythrophlei]|uniref:Uncharacterized protein n=1 Tax=Bradyrhizobium erythrophlei TaxID=1437360 RepID=A0A1M7UW26_9BRAD|nr:hypothetical protein SAMN05444170_7020 [Bradyrhizobium erythrophlei]